MRAYRVPALRSLLPLLIAALPLAVTAQAKPAASPWLNRTEVAVGFLNVSGTTTGTAGQTPTYYLNGAGASASYRLLPQLALVAEFDGVHANKVGASSLSLTQLTYLVGGRYFIPRVPRVHPFLQLELGGVHVTGGVYAPNAFTSGGADNFALTGGGGFDVPLDEALSLRALAQYYGTSLPNGVNNRQNNLELGLGLSYRFGVPRRPQAPLRPVRARRSARAEGNGNEGGQHRPR